MDALLGYSGFVGGNLLRQREFDAVFNSRTFPEIRGRRFRDVYCACAPAEKWKANQQPENDRKTILEIIDVLATIHAERFVLISTIDVYPVLENVDETYDCSARPNHAYGANRRMLEDRVQELFAEVHIVRLPALFGQGLTKNVIFDLLHDNALDKIQPDSSFQYYNLDRLWADIQVQTAAKVRLLNLCTEPLPTRTILATFFPEKQVGANAPPAVRYDVHTRHAGLFGRSGPYRESADNVLAQLGRYIDSQRKAA